MKTVWVNRHNADGTLKPMGVWQQISVRDDTTHARVQWGEIWQASEKGCQHVWDNNKSVCYEYIGNQRGDGWFYVADGDLPPIEPNAVLCHDGNGLLLMMPADLHKKDAWNHHNKAKCWMPVPDPRHLD